MRSDYLNVPVPIFVYAMKTGRYNEIRLWLFLKFFTSGHFKLKDALKSNIKWRLDIKTRSTLTKYINWLLKKKWIAYNSKTHKYELLDLQDISLEIDSQCYMGAIIRLNDLDTFRGFVYASVIKKECRSITWTKKLENNSKGRSIKDKRRSIRNSTLKVNHYALANTYLSEKLEVEVSTLSYLKQKARLAGYISVHKNYEPLPNIKTEELSLFKALAVF